MEAGEDGQENGKRAIEVAEEVRKGQEDEAHRGYLAAERQSQKWRHCEATASTKRKAIPKSGDCCGTKRRKIEERAPGYMIIRAAPRTRITPARRALPVPRHGLSRRQYIDLLATPRHSAPSSSPAVEQLVRVRVRPTSARTNELARPTRHRLATALKDGFSRLPPALLDNLIRALENDTCVTPEQASLVSKAKKRRRSKRGQAGASNNMSKRRSAKVSVPNAAALSKDATSYQYSTAERFVKSILEWKCPKPTKEFRDLASVVTKRILTSLGLTRALSMDDRKSQQIRLLADTVACWITGILADTAEEYRDGLAERCKERSERRKRMTDDEDDDDDGEEEEEEEGDDGKKEGGDKDSNDDDDFGTGGERGEEYVKYDGDGRGASLKTGETEQTRENGATEERWKEGRPDNETEDSEMPTLGGNGSEAMLKATQAGMEFETDVDRKSEVAFDTLREINDAMTGKEPRQPSEGEYEAGEPEERIGEGEGEGGEEGGWRVEREARLEADPVEDLQPAEGPHKKVEGTVKSVGRMEDREEYRENKQDGAEAGREDNEFASIEAGQTRANEDGRRTVESEEAARTEGGALEKERVGPREAEQKLPAVDGSLSVDLASPKEDTEEETARDDPIDGAMAAVLADTERGPSERAQGKLPQTELSKTGRRLLPDIGGLFKSELPFVTLSKMIETLYAMIEDAPENTGDDPTTNALHRALYEKLIELVAAENPKACTAILRDRMDVVCGKIAVWFRSVMSKSQLAFMETYVPEVESREVREWTIWLICVSNLANQWNTWLRKVIAEAADMQGDMVSRGQWHDWTKAVDVGALLWRRFHLQTIHEAHHNATMVTGRRVVKTGARGVIGDGSEREIGTTDMLS